MPRTGLRAAGLTLLVLAAACTSPEPAPVPPETMALSEPVEARAGGPDGLELILRSEKQVYEVNQPMSIAATFVYRGPLDRIDGWGSGGGRSLSASSSSMARRAAGDPCLAGTCGAAGGALADQQLGSDGND